MKAYSLRNYDSVADRIRHSRQSDKRSVVVVEGPSDQRLLDRLTAKRWAIYPAGTRNVVIDSVERALKLGIDRLAGLIDRDFDDAADSAASKGLPIVSYEEADLEAALMMHDWFDAMILELASPQKLAENGGVAALREAAVKMATQVGAVRRENTLQSWGISFKKLELHKRVSSDSLELNAKGFSSVVARSSGISEKVIESLVSTTKTFPPPPGSFRGKDALIVVQVALKRKFATKRIEDSDVLPAMLRLGVDHRLLEITPFPALLEQLDDPQRR